MRRQALKSIFAFSAAGLLAGCGFRLRGQSSLPFASAHVEAAEGSALARRLRDQLDREGRLAAPDAAEILIRLGGEARRKTILSLSGTGKVREYRLEQSVTLSVVDARGVERMPPALLQRSRDFAYSDTQQLAKEAEEAMLWREMEEETLRQILRRLSFLSAR